MLVGFQEAGEARAHLAAEHTLVCEQRVAATKPELERRRVYAHSYSH